MIKRRAGDAEAGERVDVAVARWASITRAAAQRALRSGSITVDGAPARPSQRLERGNVVEGTVEAPSGDAAPRAEDIPVAVRYSDERVMVVSKPAGVVTHPAAGHATGTLVNALLGLGEPLASRGSARPGIVHRLDKDTSGLLLVAKDDDALRSLVAALRARRVHRGYVALVRGVPGAASGTVDAPVGRHPTRRRLMAVVAGGRPSVTHYRVAAHAGGTALLEIELETGRMHQIRVHLAHLGHPVLGDRVYGGVSELSRALGLERPFLHARSLRFPHPDDGRVVAVADPLPPDLLSALERAGIPGAG